MTLSLSDSQFKFLNMEKKYRAYVGGFGSGKTFSGCLDLGTFALKHPGVPQGYFAPTYPLIRDIFYMTMEEAWQLLGESVGAEFTVDIKDSLKEVHLYANGQHYGVIICRTMDKPANIVGFKIARALVDEIDVMDEKKATQAWNKIIARLRYKVEGVVNGIGVTTTPEGFKFAYKRFKKEPGKHYGMVQASTFENEMYLPDDYIDSLRDSYPAGLIDAYLLGEFVNLEGGVVYNQFDRKLNLSSEIATERDKLLIGMDFNVQHMAARVFVQRNQRKEMHCVDEFDELYDTKDMIEHIKMRYPGREKDIVIYPDASGKNRKTVGADTSDIQQLKDAGFRVKAHDSNPRVKSRVNAVNAMFLNGNGERRLFINADKCPNTMEGIEQQIYNDKGEPDKSSGNDHGNDAFGYPIVFEYPIERKAGFRLNRVA